MILSDSNGLKWFL